MTKDEFERAYAERGGVTVAWLHASHRRAIPCYCGDDICEGWQMVSGLSITTNPEYDLEKMLPGVLNACIDGGGCRWCMRQTHDKFIGHDGHCPVPALFKLVELHGTRAQKGKEIHMDDKPDDKWIEVSPGLWVWPIDPKIERAHVYSTMGWEAIKIAWYTRLWWRFRGLIDRLLGREVGY